MPEEAEIKKNIEDVQNSPEVRRELNKMYLKGYLKGYWGRALIVLVLFAAFAELIVATQHKDDFIFWVMIGLASIAVILAVSNIIDLIKHRYEKKRARHDLRNAVILLAISIIFFGIALCSYLPTANVMTTAAMLIAAPALLFAVTHFLRNYELVGGGRFKNLPRKKKIGVVVIYVVESLLVAGAIVGGVFFLLQLCLPLLAVGVVAFFILLIPLNNKED